jgi:hypothetical protein
MKIVFYLFFIGIFVCVFGCKKERSVSQTIQTSLPTVTTSALTGITNDGVTAGGVVLDGGDSAVTERGIIWGTDSLLNNAATNKIIEGADTGSFSVPIAGLRCSTKYFVKAYAKNAIGIGYGNTISFTTSYPTYLQHLNLYKNRSIDTILLNGVIMGNALRVQVNHVVLSELQLPSGIYLYVKFDSVYHNISSGSNSSASRFMNTGDTIHFSPTIGTGVSITAEQWVTGMGDIYYDSYGKYSIHLAGITNTTETSYNCKFFSRSDLTNTYRIMRFVYDPSCNSLCPFY